MVRKTKQKQSEETKSPEAEEEDEKKSLSPTEEEATSPSTTTNKKIGNIVLIVHLRRDVSGSSFPLVFDRQWNIMFVDSLSSTSGMKLDTVATETVGDIFDQWASSVLKRVCRRSLAHLQFSTWEQKKTRQQ